MVLREISVMLVYEEGMRSLMGRFMKLITLLPRRLPIFDPLFFFFFSATHTYKSFHILVLLGWFWARALSLLNRSKLVQWVDQPTKARLLSNMASSSFFLTTKLNFKRI